MVFNVLRTLNEWP